MENIDLYLKKLFTLKTYIKNLENVLQQPIDLQKSQYNLYIINKDIIGYYLYSDMYQLVDSYINDNINNNKQYSIEDFKSKYKNNINTNFDDADNEMLKTFVQPEKLMIKNVVFFNNFFIVNDQFLEVLFDKGKNNNNNKNNTDKEMIPIDNRIVNKKAYIGKEGIFIVDYFKNEQEEVKVYIYFIKNMPKISLEDFRINKLYIFNDEYEFKYEFDNYMKGKTAEKYFALRNFINKGGIFNIMDNAKRIGLYIHIDRIENYEDKEETNEERNYLEKFLSF